MSGKPSNVPLKFYDTRSKTKETKKSSSSPYQVEIKMEGQPTASQSNPQPSAVSMAASTASSTPSTSVSAQSAQSSAPGTATTAPRSAVSESLSPQPFSGTASEDGNAWILYFKRFAIFRRFTNDDIIRIFPLFLRGTAVDWYDQLSEGVRGNAEQLEQAFIARFTPSDFTR